MTHNRKVDPHRNGLTSNVQLTFPLRKTENITATLGPNNLTKSGVLLNTYFLGAMITRDLTHVCHAMAP